MLPWYAPAPALDHRPTSALPPPGEEPRSRPGRPGAFEASSTSLDRAQSAPPHQGSRDPGCRTHEQVANPASTTGSRVHRSPAGRKSASRKSASGRRPPEVGLLRTARPGHRADPNCGTRNRAPPNLRGPESRERGARPRSSDGRPAPVGRPPEPEPDPEERESGDGRPEVDWGLEPDELLEPEDVLDGGRELDELLDAGAPPDDGLELPDVDRGDPEDPFGPEGRFPEDDDRSLPAGDEPPLERGLPDPEDDGREPPPLRPPDDAAPPDLPEPPDDPRDPPEPGRTARGSPTGLACRSLTIPLDRASLPRSVPQRPHFTGAQVRPSDFFRTHAQRLDHEHCQACRRSEPCQLQNAKRATPLGRPFLKECPAASYSPTRSPLQYHRR